MERISKRRAKLFRNGVRLKVDEEAQVVDDIEDGVKPARAVFVPGGEASGGQNGAKGRIDVYNRPALFFALCGVLVLFASLIAVAVFFLRVRGAEEVMVPDVREKEVIAALLELQKKELDARIQLRYASRARGEILEQEPKAGTIVKAGRKIRLVVSQGALVSNVGNYVGRNIDDVRSELRTLFGTTDPPLLAIKDPVLYQYSMEAAGTILEQDPLPGAGIADSVAIRFVVSKGGEAASVSMPRLLGLSTEEALAAVNKAGIRWLFSSRPAAGGEDEGRVVSQEPAGGETLPVERTAFIVVASPAPGAVRDNEVASLFSYYITENPYPMRTELEAILPSGERKMLMDVNHYGGEISYPYRLPKGTALVLSLLGREIYRETI
jgi:beta-lactam-binding protein with PASTA domain